MKLLGIHLPTEPHHIAKPILLCTLLIICFFFVDKDQIALYNPLIHAEYYRLLTANFTHSNFYHLIMNCFGVLLIWLFFADHLNWPRYFVVLITCCVGGNIAGFWLSENNSLVGISGALHGMFMYGAMRDIIEKTNIETGSIILIGGIGKVTLENTMGLDIGSSALIGTRVAVEAHLSGVICGLMLGILSWLWVKPLWSSAVSQQSGQQDSNTQKTN